MLQVSRLAPRLLGESAERVRGFVEGRLTEDGGFAGRDGRADLYYTVFGLDCLEALRAEIPRRRAAAYLRGFGDGDGLDLVHLACLARAWAALGAEIDGDLRAALLGRLAVLAGEARSVTDRFLVVGACQDLAAEPPGADDLESFLSAQATEDGGWANEPPASSGSTPATAAAVTLLASLGRAVPESAGPWLESRHSVHGGFTAAPGVAMPDLLSTAVVLHALAALQRPLAGFVEPCLDFVDTLWTSRGAFHGHWADDEVDCEYTYYGLLALGHLSLWTD
jgi:hypothetical protein